MALGIVATLPLFCSSEQSPSASRNSSVLSDTYDVSPRVRGVSSDVFTQDTTLIEPAPDERLRALLMQGDYDAAVELYARAYSHVDEHIDDKYRDALLMRASDLIQSGEYDSATALLDRYLAIFFRDTEALIYAGRAYRENRQYRPAIEAFLMASLQDQHPDMRRLVTGQLSWTISLYVQLLREEERFDEVADLYAYLTHANPRNPHYLIALANAYMTVGRVDDALAALYVAAAEDTGASDVQEMITNIHLRTDPIRP